MRSEPWTPTRAAALARLEAFLPLAGRSYAVNRNYDLGPGRHVHVSALSPWIRHRLILEQEVLAPVASVHGFAAAAKFIEEVFWRSYWKGWLELRPGVWTAYRLRLAELVSALQSDAGLHERWEQATGGRTGIGCFDAWARELRETNYLHNHARMWFASIWIFTLDLPWELGADFFLRHLLDGDAASNTLSWRWVAGLQTRGKTYLARRDNIARYTAGRFPAVDGLSESAPPPDSRPPPPPAAPPSQADWSRALPTGLLLTEDDLHPQYLLDTQPDIRAVALLRTTDCRSPLGVAPAVRAFADGAFADALSRIPAGGEEADCRAEESPGFERLVEWSQRAGLRQVLTPYAPVGPTADKLHRLTEALAPLGVRLIPVLRDWDRHTWPHATRGFFQFRKKIPDIWARAGADAA